MKPFNLLNCIFQKTLILVILLILFPIQGISQNEQKKEPSLKGKTLFVYMEAGKDTSPLKKRI